MNHIPLILDGSDMIQLNDTTDTLFNLAILCQVFDLAFSVCTEIAIARMSNC